ncbi:MAG: hypothetical protein PHD06_09890 [Bacteroidales bacterium]|jgi:hypothetical protein|nr:hypothetical protein [Bacteroidales bacterium]MDD4385472.1 hypothetical protein [Bacteroidales bacterium]MDY0196422.1 hypothetical protein [Tenuifilaceae bacterium]
MREKNIIQTTKNLLSRILSKRHTLSLAIVLVSIVAMARSPLASEKQIGMFLNSTTCVVLENGVNLYNGFIKEAVEKHWKTTPFEFIDETEFEIRRFDSRYSFLVLMKNVYDNDPGGVSYDYISLVLGSNAQKLADMPEISNIPLKYSDDNNLDYEYAIPAIVKFVQIHAKNLEKKRFGISLRELQYYNKSGFKGKQLLMNRGKMAPDAYSIDKINSIYPYFIKLLSSSEIQEEIASNPKNALFHFHVGPNQDQNVGKCFEMIFDVDGNLYYYHSRMITNADKDGFNISDFKRIK